MQARKMQRKCPDAPLRPNTSLLSGENLTHFLDQINTMLTNMEFAIHSWFHTDTSYSVDVSCLEQRLEHCKHMHLMYATDYISEDKLHCVEFHKLELLENNCNDLCSSILLLMSNRLSKVCKHPRKIDDLPDSPYKGFLRDTLIEKYSTTPGLGQNRSGVTVVPIFDQETVKQVNADLLDEVASYKEYKDQSIDVSNPKEQFALGSLGALPFASSFHSPQVRSIREKAYRALIEKDNAVFPDISSSGESETCLVEQIMDTLNITPKDKGPSGVPYHRKMSAFLKEGEVVYGGWLNLNPNKFETQTFRCVPNSAYTPIEVPRYEFATGTWKMVVYDPHNDIRSVPAQDQWAFRAKTVEIQIPPGHLLLFDKKTVHEVTSTKYKHRDTRLHISWRLTTTERSTFCSLIPKMEQLLKEQAPMPVDSWKHLHDLKEMKGHRFHYPVSPLGYSSNLRLFHPDILANFTHTKLNPMCTVEMAVRCKFDEQSNTYKKLSVNDGTKTPLAFIPLAHMPSLKTLNYCYEDYTASELAMHRPNNVVHMDDAEFQWQFIPPHV